MIPVFASVPESTVSTKPGLNCGSERTQFISSSSTRPWISAIRAGLGSVASPSEIAPAAGKSKLVSKLSKLVATSTLFFGVFSTPETIANQIPTRLSITLYEIGFRDSTSGNLNPVFKDSSGNTMIDLVEYKGKPTNLTNGLQAPSDGTFDQLYFITSNNPLASGNNGSGCYIKPVSYTHLTLPTILLV